MVVGGPHPGYPGAAGRGLWRRPVAHLVRIEGVRGSNPLSSTLTHLDLGKLSRKIVEHILGTNQDGSCRLGPIGGPRVIYNPGLCASHDLRSRWHTTLDVRQCATLRPGV